MNLENKTILITGAAGFIGANLAKELLEKYGPLTIVGIDNMCDYYDVKLKEYRLECVVRSAGKTKGSEWIFIKGSISDFKTVNEIFEKYNPEVVINLAAQAGVRYSLENPDAYIDSNIIGFYNILKACSVSKVKHLVFASSSSVYGDGAKIPYSESDRTDSPISIYAATKKADEALAYAYSGLYKIPTTGLRFFTVYGPAGRPDMAYFGFTEKLVRGEKIRIFNYGDCKRDFTYIDDIVKGVIKVAETPPEQEKNKNRFEIYNIGNNNPENLLDFVQILTDKLKKEKVLPPEFDVESHIELVGMQPGDVKITFADMDKFGKKFGILPKTDLATGLGKFAKWYKEYYR